VAVHVYGKMELVEDDQELFDSLADLVHKYERPGSSYQLENVDITGMSKGIVGFKIKIEKIEGKAKLSQNHTVERQELVIKQLEAAGETKISGLMKESINLPNTR
jgi:transcriptional regulator